MKQVLEDVRDAYVFGRTQLSAMLRLLPHALPPRGSSTHDRTCCLPPPSGTLLATVSFTVAGTASFTAGYRINQHLERSSVDVQTTILRSKLSSQHRPHPSSWNNQSRRSGPWSLVSQPSTLQHTSFPWGMRSNGTRSTPTGTRQDSSLKLLYVSEPAGAYRPGHLFVSCDKDAQYTRIRPRQ